MISSFFHVTPAAPAAAAPAPSPAPAPPAPSPPRKRPKKQYGTTKKQQALPPVEASDPGMVVHAGFTPLPSEMNIPAHGGDAFVSAFNGMNGEVLCDDDDAAQEEHTATAAWNEGEWENEVDTSSKSSFEDDDEGDDDAASADDDELDELDVHGTSPTTTCTTTTPAARASVARLHNVTDPFMFKRRKKPMEHTVIVYSGPQLCFEDDSFID